MAQEKQSDIERDPSTGDDDAGPGPPPLPLAVNGAAAGPPPLPGPNGSAPLDAPSDNADKDADGPAPAASNGRQRPAPTGESEPATKPARRRSAKRRPAAPARARIAANDDAPSIGGLIYALNQKPSRKPFIYAATASGVWLALSLGLAAAWVGGELASAASLADVLVRPQLLASLATALGPIALFWFLAVLTNRMEELRMRSHAMTEVAVRLAEPDRLAEQQIASLGQAVRRQVSFMNDAVSRAVGRAGELEIMVQSEVAALERSYEDNERRIRGLLQELVNERTSLGSTGDNVRETLQTLGSEIPALIDKLTQQQVKLSHIIESAGENLTQLEGALGHETTRLDTALQSRSQELRSMLEGQAESIAGMLAGFSDAMGGALEARSGQMQDLLQNQMETIDASIADKTQVLQTVFEEYGRALDMTIANRAEALDQRLIERTSALDDAFSERLRLLDESILRSTMAVDSSVGESARAVTAAIEEHARNFGQVMTQKSQDLDEALVQGISAVRRTSENISRQSIDAIKGLANQTELLKNVSENILSQIHSVTSRFETQGHSILRAANALETANSRIDQTLQARHNELGQTLDRLSGRADEIGRIMQGYSTDLEGSLSEAERRTRLLTDELRRGAREHSELTVQEIEQLRNEMSQSTDRALNDLRADFAAVSREVAERLGTLQSQLSASTGELRERAVRAASELEREQLRLREQMDRMPTATRESADAMRRSLQDQLRALDELSALTSRNAQRRDVSQPTRDGPTAPPGQRPSRSLPRPSAPRGADGGSSLSTLSSTVTNELANRQRVQVAHHQSAPGQPAPQGGAPADGREGWSLGDLLARASKDEPPHAGGRGGPGGTGGPALNVEAIARAIDPPTAASIWGRLRTGQRGIMVRSIYNEESRALFDDVVRRYEGEPPTRRLVDQYIGEFEQLLRESDQSDPSGRTTQTRLVSPGGRVYLFLAHASGRLA